MLMLRKGGDGMASNLAVKLQEVLSKVDNIKPNGYSDEQKTAWVNKVEGMVQVEIMELLEADVVIYDWSTDAETELLVKHPYSDVYEYYTLAMIDFMNGDVASYQNSMMMFNMAYEEYGKWYKRNKQATTTVYIKNYW